MWQKQPEKRGEESLSVDECSQCREKDVGFPVSIWECLQPDQILRCAVRAGLMVDVSVFAGARFSLLCSCGMKS